MRNSKHISFAECVRRFLMCRKKLRQQVFPVKLLPKSLSIFHFLACHARDQEIVRVHERNDFPQGIATEDEVPFGYLSHDACNAASDRLAYPFTAYRKLPTIVPLHVVNGLDGLLQIITSIEKTKLPRKCNLA